MTARTTRIFSAFARKEPARAVFAPTFLAIFLALTFAATAEWRFAESDDEILRQETEADDDREADDGAGGAGTDDDDAPAGSAGDDAPPDTAPDDAGEGDVADDSGEDGAGEEGEAPDADTPAGGEASGKDESDGDDDTIANPPRGDARLPEIITDLEAAPFPVRKMRELILEAARAGDIEKLRPYIGYGDDVTMLSLGGYEEDPIRFLQSLSGDAEGHEILAIITEILEAPFVRLDAGTDREVYVWPYFYAYPFDKLTPEQRVDLFRIITYGDFEEMAAFGSYIFYRLGITPEGRWRFFVAGD